jgi:hypothetical protein
MTVVSDTSAISNLLQIDLINLLHDLYEEIIIPPDKINSFYPPTMPLLYQPALCKSPTRAAGVRECVNFFLQQSCI